MESQHDPPNIGDRPPPGTPDEAPAGAPDNRSAVWRRADPQRRADPTGERPRVTERNPQATGAVPTPDEVATAARILFSHPPQHVARWVCACGEEYPCRSVDWALRINAAALVAAGHPPPPKVRP